MNNRLGCFSTTAIIAAIITGLVVFGVALAGSNQLFSPGELNAKMGQVVGGVTSHAQIKDCAACHPSLKPSDNMAMHCLACHDDVATQKSDPSTLHGKIYKAKPAEDCRACHREHRGAAAPLTEVTGDFPHEDMGFSLIAHASKSKIACADCHAGNYKTFDQANCITCHRQYDTAFTTAHLLSFGTNCVACHDGRETVGKNFDHAKTSFPLTGLHTDLPCSKCHIDARSLADLKSAPITCEGCHAKDDNHDGRFGKACGACHTPDGWKPAKFDHNLANFKLTGKHVGVACEKCHTNGKFKGTASTCASCHLKDDPHQGQLGTDCSLCHTPDGWKPSIFDHKNSTFPLTGAHLTVECQKCHTDKLFKGTPTLCGTCHAKDDNHNGRFGQDCGLCHSTTAWKPATFDHNLSAFKLTGAHASLACERCHKNGQFTGTPKYCNSCHADPAFHSGMFGFNCANCHNTRNWSANYTGPHPNFGDEGGIGHGGASCRDCHTQTLHNATCTKCHDSNNPSGDGGGGGD
jgi:hypothetical protein